MAQLFSQTIISGVGLLGGAVGLASKRSDVAGRIVGLGRSESKLSQALRQGAIDVYATSLRDALGFVESAASETNPAPVLIVFCAPVDANLRALEEFWRTIREPWFPRRRYVVSDVGSVKSGFSRLAEELASSADLPDGVRVDFVPAHPMAGSDKSGSAYSTADLFDRKLAILTPWLTEAERRDALATGEAAPFEPPRELENDPTWDWINRRMALVTSSSEGVDSVLSRLSTRVATDERDATVLVREFWRRLGCFVVETSAEEHDQFLARASHLPHLLAALATSVEPLDEFLFTGTGFRDVTRLAGGNPDVWTEIFGTNRLAMLDAIERFETNLSRWKTFLAEDDRESILTFLQETKKKRDALGS